jgi:hypothetical protein
MINREVEIANSVIRATKRIKELSKGMEGMKKACIEMALTICQILAHPVPGTKNNPIKFSKRWKRE